jgi:glycosyltransferase involved in cell wall biosynthesis
MLFLIVPCFNEDSRLNLVYWAEIFEKNPTTFFVFVDDGSTDSTRAKINDIAYTNVLKLNLDNNLGKANAVRFGMWFVVHKYNPDSVGFLDADGAFHVDDITAIIKKSQKLFSNGHYKSILSSRVSLQGRIILRKKTRHYISRVLLTYICQGWKIAPYDSQSGFKIFHCDDNFVKSIESNFKTRWFFDIEILTRLSKYGSITHWEEPLNYWKDMPNSKISFKQSLKLIREIFIVKAIVRNSIEKSDLL